MAKELIDPSKPVELWERWDGESSKAFSAFRYYRDTPAKDRSIRKCVAAYFGDDDPEDSRVRQWEKWSTKWDWINRVNAWENEKDRIARLAQIEEIDEMHRRHIRIAMSVQGKAAEALKGLAPEHLSPREVLLFFTEAARLERISRGEPETIEELQLDTESIVRTTMPVETLNKIADLVGLEEIVERRGGIPKEDEDLADFLPSTRK